MASVIGVKNTGMEGNAQTNKMAGSDNEYTLTYVVSASSSETVMDILEASGLPSLYSEYGNGYCKRKTAREVDVAAGIWEVEVTFSTDQDSSGDEDEQIKVATKTWSVETMDLLVRHDQETGKPIVNSVNEPLLVTAPFPIPVLKVERLEYFFDPELIITYGSHVNSKKFLGAEPDCVLLFGPTATEEIIKGRKFARVTYTFKFNFLRDENEEYIGWQAYLLNQGTKYWDAAVKRYRLFRAEGEGLELGNLTDVPAAPGHGLKRDPTKDGEYLHFSIYPKADFDKLGIV